MAEMQTVPVFGCRRCGNPVYVTHLSTTIPDPEGKILAAMMKTLGKIALCDDCLGAYNYYAAQGRMEDFYAAGSGALLSPGKIWRPDES